MGKTKKPNGEEEALRLKTLAENKELNSSAFNWYTILDLEPFSHINSIKRRYKNLALALHPDKTSLESSSEAFKLVNDAFQVLSDRDKRREYDIKLRVSLLAEKEREDEERDRDRFSTECSRCRLVLEFDRKYVGQSLVCTGCKSSFEAVEGVKVLKKAKRKMRSFDDVLKRSDRELESGNDGEEMMTLAEMRAKLRKPEGKKKGNDREEGKKTEGNKKVKDRGESKKTEGEKRAKESEGKKVKVREERGVVLRSGEMEVMRVEDSDFYDFDRDRGERVFREGQVWGIYDDDDGMPRHYGLIEEVVSVNPFEVKMRWLDVENDGDERLKSWEKMGFHVSCGRFKAGRKDRLSLVNVFSHMVTCERVAREVYRVYPHKGSVWALCNVEELETGGGKENRQYEIVVFLTSYSEMHGISMAGLEKVDGFKAVFRRKDFGYRAIKWIKQCDSRRFSHQVPARKLGDDDDVPDDLKKCWELDPAALPSDLLAVESVL